MTAFDDPRFCTGKEPAAISYLERVCFMSVAKQTEPDQKTELIDQLLAVAPEAMVIMNPDGRIVRVNTRAEKLFGTPKRSWRGKRLISLCPRIPVGT